MASKDIVFITGANTGIGFETVKALFKSDKAYHIFLGCRTPSKGDEAIALLQKEIPNSKSSVESIQIDITSDESIKKAYEVIESKFGKCDVLINNAGANFEGIFSEDAANMREIFNKTHDVNVSGTQVITITFVPLLLKSSSPRLIFLTSGLSTLAGASQTLNPKIKAEIKPGWPKDTGHAINIAYRSSKSALNMCGIVWDQLLRGDGVKVFTVSPGFLATNLMRSGSEMMAKFGAGDASLGGTLIRKVVEGERDADAGKVVSQTGVQPW